MTLKLASIVPVVLLAACATLQDDEQPTNLAAYCTPQNAYRLGSQSRAYFGVCPKDTEAAFLAGLERGRAVRPSTPAAWPFQARMGELEKQLLAANSAADRERARASLRDAEWWAIHIINDPGTYSVSP